MMHNLIQILKLLKDNLLEVEKNIQLLSSPEYLIHFKGWDVKGNLKVFTRGLQYCKNSRDKIDLQVRKRSGLEEEEDEDIFKLLLNTVDEEGDDEGSELLDEQIKEEEEGGVFVNSRDEEEETIIQEDVIRTCAVSISRCDDAYLNNKKFDKSDCQDMQLDSGPLDTGTTNSNLDPGNESSDSDEEMPYILPIRRIQFAKFKSATGSWSSNHPIKQENDKFHVICPKCKKDMAVSSLEKHIQEAHNLNLSELIADFPRFTLPVKCKKCEQWLVSEKHLVAHQCRKCQTSIAHKQTLAHVNLKKASGFYLTNHKEDPVQCPSPSQCVKCGEQMSPRTLSHHLRHNCNPLNPEIQPPQTPGNDDHDNSPSPVNDNHDNSSTDLTACPICEKQFAKTTKKAQIKAHIKNHAAPAKHSCSLCPMKFKTTTSLKSHSRVHLEIKEHLCETCGRGFREKVNLAVHMKVHSELKPFKCEQCPGTFKHIQTLRSHIESVHMEGVQCSQCGKFLSTRTKLKKHVRIVHDKLRAFPCHLCSKKFKTTSNLRYHVNTHNNPNTKNRGYNKDKD